LISDSSTSPFLASFAKYNSSVVILFKGEGAREKFHNTVFGNDTKSTNRKRKKKDKSDFIKIKNF
jgi:hypothetical protein